MPVVAAPESAAAQNGDEAASSPAEIDARRARQLLERAADLSERNDTSGALLACRQAIALAPTAAGGYGLLGLLLERGSDLGHAVSAYEKAVQLAPDSHAERQSLQRLREKIQGQQSAAQSAAMFRFDDDELFEGTTVAPEEKKRGFRKKTSEAAAPIGASEVVTPAVVASAVVASAVMASEVAAPAVAAAAPTPAPAAPPTQPSVSSRAETTASAPKIDAPGVPAEPMAAAPHSGPAVAVASLEAATLEAATPRVAAALPPSIPVAPAIAERRSESRRREVVPVAANKRNPMDRRALVSAARPVAPAKVVPIVLTDPAPPRRPWADLWARPSFYGRSLPLLATTVLALGFLSWARNMAVARTVANDPMTQLAPLPAEPETPTDVSNPASDAGQAAVPVPATANASQNDAFPVTNGPAVPPNPLAPSTSAPSTSAPSSPSTSAPAGQVTRPNSPATSAAGTTGSAPRTGSNAARRVAPQPRFPAQIPPAPVPTASSGAPSGAAGGARNPALNLPAPDLGASATAAPPVTVLPSGGNTALNPAGSSNRGFVRITQGRVGGSTVPARSSTRGDDEERGAAAASRNGQSDQVINRLTTAINADPGGAGLRYQNRATAFLDRGDYTRAAADYQAAISAYSAQIASGEQVDLARAGLRAARSGLTAALAGGRQ